VDSDLVLISYTLCSFFLQSLLAALGSVQFVTNVFFAYVLLNEVVTRRIVLATIFIMAGNVFLVAFGNHQSLIYTHEELLASYKGHAYLVYCLVLILVVALHHVIYRFVVLPYLPCFTSTDKKKNMRGKKILK
jgi:drug/metabolite transporter (DMT)-like permease